MLYTTGNSLNSTQKNRVQSAVVVTPTVGSSKLADAIYSVATQETKYEVVHLLVVDGSESVIKLPRIPYNVEVMILPWNVGANGFYGHRVYAAIGHLVNSDAVFFLDEDNFYSKNHVETCMETLNNDLHLDFCFSFRNIYDSSNGGHLIVDRFESIGKPPLNLVDTSSYCFRREFLVRYGHIWHFGWGADRRFFQSVMNISSHKSTGHATLNYRLDGNPGSPTREFFETGNRQFGWSSDGLTYE